MTWCCPRGRRLSRVTMTGPRRAARGRLEQSYSLIGPEQESKWSTSAGIQARRTGAPELFQVEMEPGEIIKRFATEAHPFSALPDLDNFRKRTVAHQELPDETIL